MVISERSLVISLDERVRATGPIINRSDKGFVPFKVSPIELLGEKFWGLLEANGLMEVSGGIVPRFISEDPEDEDLEIVEKTFLYDHRRVSEEPIGEYLDLSPEAKKRIEDLREEGWPLIKTVSGLIMLVPTPSDEDEEL